MSTGGRIVLGKGNNPLGARLAYCQRCGKTVNSIMLFGDRNCVLTCSNCGIQNFGARGGDRCGGCNQYLYNAEKRELGEFEKVPGGLCDECKKEVKQQEEIVAEGGIYFKCADCKAHGVIRKTEFTQHVREKAGKDFTVPDAKERYKPCGVEFTKKDCPVCSQKETGNQGVSGKG